MKNIPAILFTGIVSFALGANALTLDRPASSAPPVESETPREETPQVPVQVAFQDNARATAQAAAGVTDLAWIGLMLEEGKDQGIRVANVFPAGPAAFAGVRTGDTLTKIGGTPVGSLAETVAAIEKLSVQKPEKLTVLRDGRPLELTVNPRSLAEFHLRYTREMLRRDPRDPRFAQQHGVSPADMSAELVRRLFEQNQRLETTLHQVLTEVQALRAEVGARRK